MEKIITYLDACIILQLFQVSSIERCRRAMSVLGDTTRLFVVGDYVALETIPKMCFNNQLEQVDFTKKLFKNAIYVRSTRKIVDMAHNLASEYGLAAMDALHASSAIIGGAQELITFEKPSKPFFNIPSNLLKVVSLYG